MTAKRKTTEIGVDLLCEIIEDDSKNYLPISKYISETDNDTVTYELVFIRLADKAYFKAKYMDCEHLPIDNPNLNTFPLQCEQVFPVSKTVTMYE